MHSKDREWRGLVWFGVSLPVIALVLTLAPVALLFPASTSHMLATINWLSPQPYVAFLFLVGLCLPFVLFAQPMHNRELRRARAIAGDDTAIPRADIQISEHSVSEQLHEPLVVRWKKWGIISTLTATEEHITLSRPRRTNTALVWSEIRLVEIWDDQNRHYGYCLYDQDGKFIEWPAKSTLTTRFLDQEIEAASAQRQGALLALIAARTRLPFRTFASELALDRETPPREAGTHTLRHATERTFTIALWALLNILIVTLPLTHVPSVNLSAAVIGAIYGMALLVYVTINRRTRHMPEYRLPAPITTLAEAPITIAISATGRDVLRATFLGGIPASALFPLIRAFHEYQITPSESQFAALVRPMLLMGVAGVSLLGIGYLLTVTLPYIEGKNVLQFDAAGLRQGRGGRQRYIRWQDIASLTIAVYPDMGASFTVASATQVIHWPANARWVQPPEGASADDVGAQFAAIVAQRAGVQPTTEWA